MVCSLEFVSVPSSSTVVATAAVAGGASSSGGGGAVLLEGIGLVQDAIKRRGVSRGWGDPPFLGRVGTHSSRVVLGAAYRAAEYFRGLACTVGVGNEGDSLDKSFPVPEGAMVLRRREYVYIPYRLLPAFSRPNVLFLYEVKAVDRDGLPEVSHGIF